MATTKPRVLILPEDEDVYSVRTDEDTFLAILVQLEADGLPLHAIDMLNSAAGLSVNLNFHLEPGQVEAFIRGGMIHHVTHTARRLGAVVSRKIPTTTRAR